MRYLLLSTLFAAASALSGQTTRVLFIGNSYVYTNDLPGKLTQLALSLGDTLVTASSTPGGHTFQQHTTNGTTQQFIDQGDWDFVALQEQSQIPSFPLSQVQSDCFPFAAELIDSIRVHSPCAEPVFYMTWGRQNGDAGNCPNWPPVCTYEGMNELLRERYLQMAVDNSASCAPVGMAWKHTRDQQPGITLYNADQSHPALAGTYLAACTFYATLFRQSPVGSTYTAGLDPATAALLQNIAASTVLDSLSTWNIGVNDPDASFTSTSAGAVVSFTPGTAAGTHTWFFGDGSSDNSTVTSHTYGQSGVYDVMHILTDACGRMDTVITPVNVVISSLPETSAPETAIAFGRPLMLQGNLYFTPDRAGRFDVWNLNGQQLVSAELGMVQTFRRWSDLPANTVLFWRFTGEDGVIDSGRLLAP
ncbi:MAG: hypothetical protein IPN85_12045 [Flavobacteriales bacterium]|nr:hypothetical protein [Flavobacteriales bacterium]